MNPSNSAEHPPLVSPEIARRLVLGDDIETVIAFARRAGVTCFRASEMPIIATEPRPHIGQSDATFALRYGNASSPVEADRMLRYTHAILDDFPKENDERPARALANYRDHFAQHIYTLRHEIARWKADTKQTHRTLTAVLWYVGDKIWKAEGEPDLFEFNQFNKPFLRFGLLTLGKLLSREIETEVTSQPTADIDHPDDEYDQRGDHAGDIGGD